MPPKELNQDWPSPDNSPEALQNGEMKKRAGELFTQGFNCCESVLKAGIEALALDLPENAHLLGKFYGGGIAGTGCICGALAGGVMVLGMAAGQEKNGAKLAERFKKDFIAQFGSSCCRVLRKQQSIIEKHNGKKCGEITAFSAGLLQNTLKRDNLEGPR